jgi:hypothetical protein
MSVGIWRRNCDGQLTSELAEEGKAHANWTDFSREDLRNIEVHSGVAESTGGISA